MNTLRKTLQRIYRFKPLRTFAQVAAALLAANTAGLIGVDWIALLSVAGGAGLLAFLQAWADGSPQFANEATPEPKRAI